MNHSDYKIIVKDGKQFLSYKGEILPNQIKSTVKQSMKLIGDKSLCKVKITLLAELEESK